MLLGWLIFAIYALIGGIISLSILRIRSFDRARLGFGAPRRWKNEFGKTKGVGNFDHDDTTGVALLVFFAGMMWPFGVFVLWWHLSQVEWSSEQRALIKELFREESDAATEKLRQKLEKKRQDNLNRLEELAGVNRE